MRDAPQHQAVGLIGLAESVAPQLLAVVSHGDARTELPLLWQLSTALCQMGYAVTVLDGNTPESPDNPGLLQLLEDPFCHHTEAPESADWQVLASAQGLRTLCGIAAHAQVGLQRLGDLFQNHGILLLYAGVERLSALLGDTAVRPLLGIRAEKNALMTGYGALKRLLQAGRLEPTVLSLESADTGAADTDAAVQALRACAQNFLAYPLEPLRLPAMPTEPQREAAMRRLAAQLLEHAWPLPCAPQARRAQGKSEYGVWSRSH